MSNTPWSWIPGIYRNFSANAFAGGYLIDTMPPEYQVNAEISLRPMVPNESRHLFQLVAQNRDHLRPWLNWVDDILTVKQAKQNILNWLPHSHLTNQWAVGIYLKGNLVGMADIGNYDQKKDQAEIGYWLVADEQGKGSMHRVVAWLLRHCFETIGLQGVKMQCAAQNERSLRIPLHFGFSHTATDSAYQLRPGESQELLTFSLQKEEWNSRVSLQANHFENLTPRSFFGVE